MVESVPQGGFFEDIETFSLLEIDPLAYLQISGGAIVRVAGQEAFPASCFHKAERQG